MNNKNDEVDLINLLERVLFFFRYNARLILLSSITGIVIGVVLYLGLPKTYYSSLLLHSFTLTNTEHINIIENWNELLKKGEYESLAIDLGCEPLMIKRVKKITASEIQKLYIQNNPNGFMVEVFVSDTAILDSLQKGIIHGLENGEYIKEKLQTKRENLTELIQKADSEIIKLDSTKQSIENSIINNSKGSSSYIIDISNISGQVMNLNEKLLGYREELKFVHAVQILHDFPRFKNPESPKLFKCIILGFLGGFFIGYVLAVFFNLKQKVEVGKNH